MKGLTEIQGAIRDSVRAFAQDVIRPHSARFEAEGGYPSDLFQAMASLGLWGMTAPEAFGGADADAVSYALALMEVAAADGALSTIVSIQNSILVSGLLKDGSEAQKARFLPDLIAGRMIGAFALTEADAGSDASAVRTRTEKVDGGWRITGAKQFITSGRIAGVVMIIAVTDAGAGKKGLSAFIVPTDRPGYAVDKVEGRAVVIVIGIDDLADPGEAHRRHAHRARMAAGKDRTAFQVGGCQLPARGADRAHFRMGGRIAGGEDFVHARCNDRPILDDDRAERSSALPGVRISKGDGFAEEAFGFIHGAFLRPAPDYCGVAVAFHAATLARVSASMASSAARSCTVPRRITAWIDRVAAMSSSGLRSSSTRSAALPRSTEP